MGTAKEHDAVLPGSQSRPKPASHRHRWSLLLVLALILTWHPRGMFERFRCRSRWTIGEPTASRQSARHHAGTKLVEWDGYSLFIRGQRVFIQSGEFHTWRLPVVDLWEDIVQKFKAGGLNTMSIYVHWGLVEPTPGKTYWDGYLALQPLFDMCKRAGLWVIVRPGPYINAETTAGGIPGWVTTIDGHLRTNDTAYADAWQTYIKEVSHVTARNQISEGGPVILVQVDNEYVTDANKPEPPGKDGHMQDLEDAFRRHGIVVPITFNDWGPLRNFNKGLGSPDIYGIDSYPLGFDCSNPQVWKPLENHYSSYHRSANPDQPLFIPEFQAGAFDPWGPNAPGYAKCAELTGADFQSVFFLNNWAHNVKMINFYMMYGGTSHGYLAFPGVYTSYDYGSPIAEDRSLTSKYTGLKRQSLFLRSSPSFYATEIIGNSSTVRYSSNPDVFVTELRNLADGSVFYVVRNRDSTASNQLLFKLRITARNGVVEVPLRAAIMVLAPRESRVIVADYFVGNLHVRYSTASVLFAGRIGHKDVLYLYGSRSELLEANIKSSNGSIRFVGDFMASTEIEADDSTTVLFFPNSDGLAVAEGETWTIFLSNSDQAGTAWAPFLGGPAEEKYDLSSRQRASLLVWGPDLVRNASWDRGRLSLVGDVSEGKTPVVVYAGGALPSVLWNGVKVDTERPGAGLLTFTVSADAPKIEISDFSDWKHIDSLPELGRGYDDGKWVVANHTSTTNPWKRYSGEYNLYGCDYGFCNGAVIWRGHFDANASAIELSLAGGEAFAATVWLNDAWIGVAYGNSSNNLNIIDTVNKTFAFPADALRGKGNIVTVVLDNMGMDEAIDSDPDTSKHPRGIRGYELVGGGRVEWKVQGQRGGFQNVADPHRGITNENGFFAVRNGYHLPGFDDSTWGSASPITTGLSKAGIGFYRTTFSLDVEDGYDVTFSLDFADEDEPYRAEVWINGWQMARRVANLGPQTRFPIQEGILDHHGTNTLAVALWAMEDRGAKIASLDVSVRRWVRGGVGRVLNVNPGSAERTVL